MRSTGLTRTAPGGALCALPALVSSLPALVRYTFRAVRDPADGDAVAAVGELTALNALESMKLKMMAESSGRRILKERPRVTDALLQTATSLGPHTFGYEYAQYMNRNKFLPSGRTPVAHIQDPTLAYVMTRYRETHDFLHACTGCGRTVEEELAVKLLEWYHTGIPLGLLAVIGGAPHLSRVQWRNVTGFYHEWAACCAPNNAHGSHRAVIPCYLTHRWEEMLTLSVDEVAAVTGIIPINRFVSPSGQQRSFGDMAVS